MRSKKEILHDLLSWGDSIVSTEEKDNLGLHTFSKEKRKFLNFFGIQFTVLTKTLKRWEVP